MDMYITHANYFCMFKNENQLFSEAFNSRKLSSGDERLENLKMILKSIDIHGSLSPFKLLQRT